MKRFIAIVLITLVLSSLISVTAAADTGPKPSIKVRINGLDDVTAYATLLSESSFLPGGDRIIDPESYIEKEIIPRFESYTDQDGYYFQSRVWDVSDGKELYWTYYPPTNFKLLVYFPETDTFKSSTKDTRYAFHSEYDALIEEAGITLVPDKAVLCKERLTNLLEEILDFLARVGLTLLIELTFAYFCLFRELKQIGVICLSNIATQLLLNAIIFLSFRNVHDTVFIVIYLVTEVLIAFAEGFVYSRCFPKISVLKPDPKHCMTYALAANALSFVVGLMLSGFLPIF